MSAFANFTVFYLKKIVMQFENPVKTHPDVTKTRLEITLDFNLKARDYLNILLEKKFLVLLNTCLAHDVCMQLVCI